MAELDVPRHLNRSAYLDQEEHRTSARWLLGYLAELMGSSDLGGVDVLDMGCGTKLSEAIVNEQLPVGSYHGVDVNPDVIGYLSEHNTDRRFSYHHLPVENELYNPGAPKMRADEDLGCGDRRFDLVTLFSVFTHLAPDDYVTMLKLMRRYVRDDSTLFFTVFIDELTTGGFGISDFYDRMLGGEDSAFSLEERQELRQAKIVPYVDLDPERPLVAALYSREHAIELIDGTGWEVVEVRDPIRYAQHQVVCSPS